MCIRDSNGVTLKYPVRALLGANEETNMHDVDYFAAHFAVSYTHLDVYKRQVEKPQGSAV